MPTIFQQLSAGVDTGAVTGSLDLQIGGLSTIGESITGLVEHPPAGIDDLLRYVQTIAVPDVQIGADLPGALRSLNGVFPADLSSVTGGLSSSIETLGAAVGSDLAASISAGLGPILELRRLLEIDAGCLFDDAPAPGPGGATPAAPPAPGPAPGGSAAAPSATARAAAAIERANGALDIVPAAFTTEALLRLIANGLEIADREVVAARPIPIFDELHDGLDTLLEWHAATPAQILSSLAATLASVRGFVTDSLDAAFGTLGSDASAVAAALGAASLEALGSDLVVQIDALTSAAQSGDLSATGASVQAIGDHLDALATGMPTLTTAVLDRLPALEARLQALPGELDDQVAHVVATLALPIALPPQFPGPDPIIPIDQDIVDTIDAMISPLIGWLQDIAAKLDVTAIEQPIQTAAAAATAAIDGVEQAIAAVTTGTQQLFGEAEQLLDALDGAAIVADVQQALDDFKSAVTGRLTTLFAPIRAALDGAMGAIDAAVGGFDPAKITSELEKVTTALHGVLGSDAVVAARDQMTAAIGAAESALAALSFHPITDDVVGTLDAITEVLEAIPAPLFPPPLQAALAAAAAALPQDLEPITDPLLEEMQEAVDSGPGALAAALHEPLAQLQAQVRGLEPAALVGDALSAPFADAVTALQSFTPSRLLEPLDGALALVADRLREEVGPGRLLAPLQAPFDELLAAFDRLDPAALVTPVEAALQGVIATVLDALPTDEILAPIERVLGTVADVAQVGRQAVAVMERIRSLLDVLEDGPGDVQAFADGVLDKLSGIDAASLQDALDALAGAIAGTTAAALRARSAAALGALTEQLEAIAPGDRLAAIAVARGAALQALDGLPASPQKAAAEAALARADALAPPLAGPLGALGAFQRRAAAAAAALDGELQTWDDRYHGDGDTLPAIAALQATPAAVTAWVRDALQPQVVAPLRALLAPTGPVRAILGPVIAQLQALLTVLEDKLAVFGTGAGSVGEITSAIDGVLARLRGLDLAFLRDSLAELHANVRAKIVAISPGALGAQLDAVFDDVVGALDVDQLLPTTQIEALDQRVLALVGTLDALNPATLVVDVVQPVFEQDVLPLIDAFDIGAALDRVLTMLHGLLDELDGELARVNASYKAMLAAVPEPSPISIDIDVGVDVGGFL